MQPSYLFRYKGTLMDTTLWKLPIYMLKIKNVFEDKRMEGQHLKIWLSLIIYYFKLTSHMND